MDSMFFSSMRVIKIKRMRMLQRAIKRCGGQVFTTCDMNSKDYSVWMLWGALNNRVYNLQWAAKQCE